jgi:signal peptidase I
MTHRLARPVLTAVVLGLALLGVLAAAAIATNRATLVTTHGVSMHPLYEQGDLVVVANDDSYQVGQIVAYRVPTKGIVVLHRIISETAAGFVMKGDNNQSIDPTTPTARQILGRAVLHIPHGGLWLDRLTRPLTLAVIAFALTAGGGTAIETRRRRKRAAMSRHANRSPGSTRTLFALPQGMRTIATTIAVVAVGALALGALAWSAPLDRLTRTSTQATKQMSFAYAASVGRTPAYDGTTVHSPDPVFRRLSDTVDLHLAYRGSPGSVTVTAELSNPAGWHSTVPLAAAAATTGTRYESTVLLDLKAFDAHAQSAAAATGLPAGPLTVAVVATVKTTGAAPFTPRLTLNLTPLQLSIVGDAANLTVRDATTTAHTAHVAGTLTLLGRHLTVAHAQALSAILLLAALIAAGLLAFIARHGAPVGEGAGIRRRYAPLLASVDPIPTPTNLLPIDVSEFATLAKLAERCGQLVLHWSRAGVDTFIVMDEGTTYRYRTGIGTTTSVGATTNSPARLTSPSADHPEHPQLESI